MKDNQIEKSNLNEGKPPNFSGEVISSGKALADYLAKLAKDKLLSNDNADEVFTDIVVKVHAKILDLKNDTELKKLMIDTNLSYEKYSEFEKNSNIQFPLETSGEQVYDSFKNLLREAKEHITADESLPEKEKSDFLYLITHYGMGAASEYRVKLITLKRYKELSTNK